MKNSGIDWLGNIPDGWKKIRCKFLARTYTGNSIKDEEKELYTDCENSVPYIATKDISLGNNQINKSDILYIKNEDTNFVRAEKGDILLCVEGGSAGKKKTYLQEDVCFVNKLCCFHSFGINSAFLFYTMQSPHYEAEFFFNMSGLIGGVSRSKLDNFTIPAPTREEQESIVRILNDKVKKIDKLIEVQQAQIEKLKEYKQSVITEAVTKGLDPTAPMKDSGVEWIGKIPEGWNVKGIKKVASFVNGYAFASTEFRNEGVMVLKITNVQPQKIVYDNLSYVDEKYYDNLTAFRLNKGDLLFALTRPIINDGIKVGIYLKDDICLINQRTAKLRPKSNLNSKWIMYLCCVKAFLWEYSLLIDVTGLQPNISANDILTIKIPLPKIEMQKEIIAYLDDKCAKIDKLIALKQSKIEKLQEYKKSLIYEYVTGKKEVI